MADDAPPSIPSLLDITFQSIIHRSVIQRQQHTIWDLVAAMPHNSYLQRKFMEQLARLGCLKSHRLRKYLPDNRWLKSFTTLEFPGFDLGAEDLFLLRFVVEDLQYSKVDLRGNMLLGPGISAIGYMLSKPSVTEIVLFDTSIGPQGAQVLAVGLAGAVNLRILNLSGCSLCWEPNEPASNTHGCANLLQTLAGLQYLEFLDLSNNCLFGARWDPFIKVWRGALQLDTAAALAALLDAQASYQTLHTLVLDKNAIGGFYDSDNLLVDASPGCTLLMYPLLYPQTHVLQALHLHNVGLRAPGAECLVLLLDHNRTITDLDVSGNALGIKGTKLLARAIRHQPVLARLCASGNSMGNEGALAMAHAFASNSCLMDIDMSNNGIDDDGIVVLLDALAQQPTLESLNLNHTTIKSQGMAAVARLLTSSSSLQSLHLAQVSFMTGWADKDLPALQQLGTAVKASSSLTLLDITKNGINTAQYDVLRRLVPIDCDIVR